MKTITAVDMNPPKPGSGRALNSGNTSRGQALVGVGKVLCQALVEWVGRRPSLVLGTTRVEVAQNAKKAGAAPVKDRQPEWDRGDYSGRGMIEVRFDEIVGPDDIFRSNANDREGVIVDLDAFVLAM